MDFDVLILGGGAAGMSCALVLGSGLDKTFGKGKKVGIVLHQKASNLQTALFNNVLGIEPGTPGAKILEEGPQHLAKIYPEVQQIRKEKVKELLSEEGGFRITTTKNTYTAARVVVAVGYTNTLTIRGLEKYVMAHQRAKASKDRIQLQNEDHVVAPGLYVAGTLAGWRSQFSIACGSGASVATDILTLWNDGQHTKVHDKLV